MRVDVDAGWGSCDFLAIVVAIALEIDGNVWL